MYTFATLARSAVRFCLYEPLKKRVSHEFWYVRYTDLLPEDESRQAGDKPKDEIMRADLAKLVLVAFRHSFMHRVLFE